MTKVLVSGAFDDLRFRDFRFLEEAGKLASDELHVALWSDELIQRSTGKPPKFPLAERAYVIGAIRHVSHMTIVQITQTKIDGVNPHIFAVDSAGDTSAARHWSEAHRAKYHVIPETSLAIAPPAPMAPSNPQSARKKVLVTGCFDWFHSGHVRFFEECSELGDLYVVVGHDANIRLLKGEGHPLLPATQRRYMAGSIRYVTQALISTGHGWLDAEPEVQRIKPDIYAVNEDGDKPEKREFCNKHGVEYVVLKRLPKEGLTRRTSTNLRGF